MLMVQLHGLTCDMFDLSPFRLQVRLQNSCAEEAVRLLGAVHRGFGCPQLMVCLEAATGAQTFVVDVFLKHVYPVLTDGSAQPHQRAGALHCLLTGATVVLSQYHALHSRITSQVNESHTICIKDISHHHVEGQFAPCLAWCDIQCLGCSSKPCINCLLACNADVCVALRSYDLAQHAGGDCEGQGPGAHCCHVSQWHLTGP